MPPENHHLRYLPTLNVNVYSNKINKTSYACRINTVEGYDKPIILN